MLPTINLPTYELKIPSSGKEILVRPFIVKEEKLLLMAAESDDDMEIVNTTKQVIKNCVLSEDVNIDTLPFFDIDYLFIALRAKSIGETIEMKFICNNVVEEQPCKHQFLADLDISKATVHRDMDVSSTINLSENLYIKMKYPTYAVVRMIADKDGTLDRKIKIMMNSIEQIVDGDTIHSAKDYSKEELREFIENLTEEQFQKMDRFISNFPTFSVDLDAECSKCKFVHHIEYRDFTSFFQ